MKEHDRVMSKDKDKEDKQGPIIRVRPKLDINVIKYQELDIPVDVDGGEGSSLSP
jgi:hypothetical protein